MARNRVPQPLVAFSSSRSHFLASLEPQSFEMFFWYFPQHELVKREKVRLVSIDSDSFEKPFDFYVKRFRRRSNRMIVQTNLGYFSGGRSP